MTAAASADILRAFDMQARACALQGSPFSAGILAAAGEDAAAGGPVAGGSSYLVGEHGPELFTPAGNGEIAPNAALGRGGAQVVVNITTQDAASFQKSRSQVAAMMARAMAQGQRNL